MIHDIDCARLRNKAIKNINVVNLAVSDPNESGDITTQIQQGMQFYSRLSFTESGPLKNRKASANVLREILPLMPIW